MAAGKESNEETHIPENCQMICLTDWLEKDLEDSILNQNI